MVTLAESIRQRSQELQSFESQLSLEEQKILGGREKLLQQKSSFLQQTEPIPLTLKRQSKLAKDVGRGSVFRRAKEIRRQKTISRGLTLPKFDIEQIKITEALSDISSQRQSIQPFKVELGKLEQFQTGFRIAEKGISPVGLGAQERKGFFAGRRQIKQTQQRAELLKIGKPLFSIGGGALVGFERGQQTVPIGLLDIGGLKQLELAGFDFDSKQSKLPKSQSKLDFLNLNF